MRKKLEFDLARNSLKYVIKYFDIKELYLPYYLCDVIRHSLIEINCKPIFYHIDDNFMPAIEFPQESFILYPNYFGICEDNVDKLVKIYPNIIIDNAHSYYSKPKGLACFNAKHKFFEESGSTLWIGVNDTFDIKPDPKRIARFCELHERFKTQNLLNFKTTPKSPFVYPFLANTNEEADNIANEFINEGITIYRYWNNLPQGFNEYKFYRRLVPIPLTSGIDYKKRCAN